MKIVRLVLLISLAGVPAACNSATVTEPAPAATVGPTPLFDGASTPDTTSRDGGHVIGTGT